ncbi:hypothetical protein ACEQPO_14640 [Bacillus sp. SL00103]
MIEQCEQLRDHFAPLLPLTFDGELVFLLDNNKATLRGFSKGAG